MICDLSSVLNNDGAELEISETINLLSEKDVLGVDFKDGVLLTGKIVCRGNVLELSAHVEGQFVTECARCLKELVLPISFDFDETLTQDGEEIADRDSVIIFEGKEIDLKELVVSNILLNLSYKYICDNNCRGICPKCGTDLNTDKCDCADDDIDPRWEQLKNFMR
ncbi:MAG: DUF177 domain-containing protein [Clostridia bacterium]|nr:DUF177 domain-containing protein [Clostridia bacterium]